MLAFLAGMLNVICLVGLWLTNNLETTAINRAMQWLVMLAFASAVWLARISILVSIMRISTSPRFSVLIRASLVLFILLWIIESAYKVLLCTGNSAYACQTTRIYADVVISMDVVSTVILVALPLVMLWNVKLARIPKTLILLVFAVGVINAAASYVHAVYLAPQTQMTGMTGYIQCAVDLIVCNLLVTVTFVYRIIQTWRNCKAPNASVTASDRKASSGDNHPLTRPRFVDATGYTNNLVEGRDMLTTVDLDSANFESGDEQGRSTIAWDPAWNRAGVPSGWTGRGGGVDRIAAS